MRDIVSHFASGWPRTGGAADGRAVPSQRGKGAQPVNQGERGGLVRTSPPSLIAVLDYAAVG